MAKGNYIKEKEKRRVTIIFLNIVVLIAISYGINLLITEFVGYTKYIIGLVVLVFSILISGYLFIYKDLGNK